MKKHELEKTAFRLATETAADLVEHRDLLNKYPTFDHATVGKVWLKRSKKWAAVLVTVVLPPETGAVNELLEISPS